MEDLIKKYEELLVGQKGVLDVLKPSGNEEAIALCENIIYILNVTIIDFKATEKQVKEVLDTFKEKVGTVNTYLDQVNATKKDAEGKDLGILSRIKSLNITPAFQNNERILLQRLVKDEISTPRKKYGTSKMNTLYSLEGKLRK
jgi:hypothetical protein